MLPDAEAVAQAAAVTLAEAARAAVASRGRFAFAVSGGSTPWRMLRLLADQDLPWSRVELFQVDERIAPDGDPDRNLTRLRESLLDRVASLAGRFHAMPVEAPDLASAAREYAGALRRVAGSPAVLDLVHLGLGPDGHTASLVPGDAVLAVREADVALTAGPYQGHRRMTLTYPVLDRARCVLWVVAGAAKAPMLARLRRGDPEIPAGRVARERALLLADRAALGGRSGILVYYSKPDCPLCDKGWPVAVALAARYELGLEKVDIRSDPALSRRYGERIPVLLLGDAELGWGRLSARALERALARALGAG